MGEILKAYVGNPVHIVLKGFDGLDEKLCGILGYDGSKYYLSSGSALMELNIRDVVQVLPLNRLRN
jgi:hypothetical protein